ncbi:hypothetical protein Patl1_34487 [Pistacia atlantica]|uniref:Uncharacterized protein n=1 Tax=Pistacia atlantica TaxID=434234 RepID=A0ACC0ZQP2_9ROSI|nr:hypothetical protein Patl1_34487 [Pistacia atlantica]
MNVYAENTFNVLDYGANGDGNSNDSLAFEKAWDETCNAMEGTPTMIIPKGKTFLVYPMTFTGPCKSSNINIRLSGIVKAPDDLHACQASERGKWLVFNGVSGLNISGFGLIDGNGKRWSDNSCKLKPIEGCTTLAPTAVGFRHCSDVHMTGIYVVWSPQTHILVTDSENVSFRSLVIRSPVTSPNTDGIHISNSRNVSVQSSIIGTGDDCISIGDYVSKIKVSYVNCGPGHGISIGSLGRDGNEVQVENITVRNVSFYKTTNGARIKTWQFYCDVKGACNSTKTGVHISNVRFSHLAGTSTTEVAINLGCNSNVPCANISLEDIRLKSATKGKHLVSSCNNAYGHNLGIVEPRSCL